MEKNGTRWLNRERHLSKDSERKEESAHGVELAILSWDRMDSASGPPRPSEGRARAGRCRSLSGR